MSAEIIDGKSISQDILTQLEPEVTALKKKGIIPGLAAVLVGDDPASQFYVRSKERACERLGIRSYLHKYSEDLSEGELLSKIAELNQDGNVHGILVQLPLPDHICVDRVLESILPEKDVDGFSPINLGRLMSGKESFVPATPKGIQELLLRSGNDPGGKHVVIVGRSNIVGKPLANLLMQKKAGANATVTVCHSRTENMKDITITADILVAAIGKPKFITSDMVKDGVVIIDVGINRVEDPTAKRGYRIMGDVDFENVKEIAKAISPVPGGVGPMTIAMLMNNVVKAAKIIT